MDVLVSRVPSHIVRRIALDGCNALYFRATSMRALGAVGCLEWRTFASQEHVLVSAEHLSGSSSVIRVSSNHISAKTDGDSNVVPSVVVKLSTAMRQCRMLLLNLRRSLCVDMCAVAEESGLSQTFNSLLRDLDSGRISSVRSFTIAVQDAFFATEVKLSPAAAVAVASLRDRFAQDVLFVEVPEIECTNVQDIRLTDDIAPVHISLELEVTLDRFIQDQALSRWMWAEVAIVDQEGTEADLFPRLRFSKAINSGSAHQRVEVSASTSRMAKGTIPGSKKDSVLMQRRISYSTSECVAAQVLHALRGGSYSLKVYLRVDWPILQNTQVKPSASRVKVAVLRHSLQQRT